MEYKEYELLNFNSMYVSKNYPKKVWPILNEYFSRYKHEFDLTDSVIQNKLHIVLNNLDSINIGGTASDSYMGMYYPMEKKIDINIELMKSLNMKDEDIFNTIFHELNHAGENLTSEYSTSFQRYNENTGCYEGIALNEIITEMKASRLAKNDRTDLLSKTGNDRNYLELDGYGDLIFIGTMIHTTLGISEKDFLKYADMGKDAFDNLMMSKFPSKDDYELFINNVTFYSDALHSVKYNREQTGPYTEEELYNINNCISGIYDNCLYAMGKVIPYQAYINKDSIDAKEYMTKANFNLEKLNVNYKHGLSNVFSTTTIDTIQNEYLDDIQSKLTALETVLGAKDKLNEYQENQLLYEISQTNLSGDAHLANMYNNYGLIPNSQVNSFDKTMDLSYETQILREEYSQIGWNNQNCSKQIKNFLKKDSLITKITTKIKNIIKFNNQRSLPAADISYAMPSANINNEIEAIQNFVNNDSEYIVSEKQNDEHIVDIDVKEI